MQCKSLQDKDGMRTDDINALAGQRADKKGGRCALADVLLQHSAVKAAALLACLADHVRQLASMTGDVWTSFYDKVKEVKDFHQQALLSLLEQIT